MLLSIILHTSANCRKIQENPKKGKHRRINVGSKGFLEDVWKFDDAKEFLRKSDWREVHLHLYKCMCVRLSC